MGRKGKFPLYQEAPKWGGRSRADKGLAELGCLSREVLYYENANCYHSFRCCPMLQIYLLPLFFDKKEFPQPELFH